MHTMTATKTERKPIMVSLFDHSTTMAQPWARAGYQCVCVDIEHSGDAVFDPQATGVQKLKIDLSQRPGRNLDLIDIIAQASFVAAFPPCTDLAVSGARWFQLKGMQRLIDALQLVENARKLCEEYTDAPYMIENPISTLSTYWRKPNYTFDPCDYALYASDPESEAYTKRTCLWTGNGFIMPEPYGVPPQGVRPGQPNAWYSKVGGSSAKTKAYRSKTSEGFAEAVFRANHQGRLI